MKHSADAAPRQVVPDPASSNLAVLGLLPLSPSSGTYANGRSAPSPPPATLSSPPTSLPPGVSPPPTQEGFAAIDTSTASSSGPKANKKQQEWIKRLADAVSWDAFQLVVREFTASMATPRATGRAPGRGRRRGTGAADKNPAQRIQKLYYNNKKVAMREIRQEESPLCAVPPDDVAMYFEQVFSERVTELGDVPEGVVLPAQQIPDEALFSLIGKEKISTRLRHCSNTAPGPDTITYNTLRSKDPGCHVLFEIIDRCRRDRRVPEEWKEARTILLYKKGDRKDLSNWRPISLSSCLYKVYSGILAARIGRWAAASGAITDIQNGFMPAEGCLEHNFILQQCLDAAKT
ncbi:Retrovirus-related Pol polyprotein from type-1 retrotransposable element R2 [Frankliniella fusca]|uniref:Retrovirus-related Pol polyprotein from type-1 retrotransposable element R2 n=1 Tax=Frankliniella fusca TaxID=407009 RepID=A0AAE1HA48_9NEOP|nr:Retrovirus-related Pol polyprotein from type-1 retrotransposable element R2 [Frankliniella fusca]